MRKIEYLSPEMEIIELKNQVALLAGSGEEAGGSGTGFAPEYEPEED